MNTRKEYKKMLDACKETPAQRKARIAQTKSNGTGYTRIIPCGKKVQSIRACRGNFPKEA